MDEEQKEILSRIEKDVKSASLSLGRARSLIAKFMMIEEKNASISIRKRKV